MSELKPCPLCGAPARIDPIWGGEVTLPTAHVSCTQCNTSYGIEGNWTWEKSDMDAALVEAIVAWNRRTPAPVVQAGEAVPVAWHVYAKGWGDELVFTEEGAKEVAERLRKIGGVKEPTITPLCKAPLSSREEEMAKENERLRRAFIAGWMRYDTSGDVDKERCDREFSLWMGLPSALDGTALRVLSSSVL